MQGSYLMKWNEQQAEKVAMMGAKQDKCNDAM